MLQHFLGFRDSPIIPLRRSPLISLGRTEKKCALVQSHRQIEGIDKVRPDDVTTIVAGFKKLVHNHAKKSKCCATSKGTQSRSINASPGNSIELRDMFAQHFTNEHKKLPRYENVCHKCLLALNSRHSAAI